MSSVNQIILLGRVGKDPEVRRLESGSVVANFTLATSETWKDKSGEKKEQTQWHNCTAWGNTAEIAEKYVHKGDLLFVSGKMVYEQYEKDGVRHTVAKVNVSNITLLGNKKSESRPAEAEPSQSDYAPEETEDHVPF